MLADAASGALIYFGAEKDNASLAAAGVAAFFLAGPAIHLAHGLTGDAGKSFLFRTVPLAVGFGLWRDTIVRKKVAMAQAPAFLP